tara:strand:- start:1211 stop:3043 length:1833 start_codon:yes stop_codon:yes gene_type:complete
MRILLPLIFCIATIPNLIFSQNRCGTDEYTILLENKYGEYKNSRKLVNEQTKNWLYINTLEVPNIITIPVVVHVVWNTNQENISDAQIFSQIDVLNADFRRTNIDAINTPNIWNNIAADCEIEFCLATIDPNGVSSTGITRTQTSQTSFSISNDNVKYTNSGGINAWPNEDYLNIWVCDLGGGLLGYATPPSNFLSNEDGVVIGYRYFGTTGNVQNPYHKGRTTTHEVGHWLNLEHVWGFGNCGNDNVNDTPTQQSSNYGCPGFPHNTNSCGTNNNNGDMFMNYMDYTNDACMNLFTNGQKNRMIAAINQYRSNLLNHNLCSNNPPVQSWNCVNGSCVDPGNGNGSFSDLNNCFTNCDCDGITPPIIEEFQSNSIPNNWNIINNDNDKTWEINEQVGYNSSKSIYINNAEYAANGEIDDLEMPNLNLSNTSSASLSFDYAYSLWTNPNSSQIWSDTLKIMISDDCGDTWNVIWEKAGTNLVTTNPVFNPFNWIPNNNDWINESINLSNYLNQDDIVIKFRNINQYENNLFIDNVNISTTPSSLDNETNKAFIYNSERNYFYFELEDEKKIFNLLGQNVLSTKEKIIDVMTLPNGVYILNYKNNNYKFYKK